MDGAGGIRARCLVLCLGGTMLRARRGAVAWRGLLDRQPLMRRAANELIKQAGACSSPGDVTNDAAVLIVPETKPTP